MKDTLLSLIQSYLDKEIDFEEVEDWYVPKLETLIINSETSQMVAQIELGLAEMEDGIMTENEFRDDLKNMLKEHT